MTSGTIGPRARPAPARTTRTASGVARERDDVDCRARADSTGSGRPSMRSDRQALAGQRLQARPARRRHGQHGIAGGQRLHRLRQQRVGVGAKAEHAAAREQRQRVRLAGRPRQVDRAEIDRGRRGDRRRALAAQMLAQDGDAVGPRRPAAKRRIRQIVGQRSVAVTLRPSAQLAAGRRRACGSAADNAARRPSGRCPTAPRRRTAASRRPRRSGCG